MIQKYVNALQETCKTFYPALVCVLEHFWDEFDKQEKYITIYCRYCGRLYRANDFNKLMDFIKHKLPRYPGNSVFHSPCLKCFSGGLFEDLAKGSVEGSKELFQLCLLED